MTDFSGFSRITTLRGGGIPWLRWLIFIMHEAGMAVPAWLSDEFTKTSVAIRSGSWRKGKSGEEFFRSYDVWKKTFAAGTVILGPSDDSGCKPKAAMYGIAVKSARP